MKNFAVLSRAGALCAILFFAVAGRIDLNAQAAAESSPPASANRSASPEELSQADLLKSYLQMRDQLMATQLAIASTRAESEAAARAQSVAINEKLESIKSAMEAERQRQQVETLRTNAEHERQQIETQRSNRTVLWVAVGFGALGLLAMLFMPVVQWRAINRMAEINASRASAPAPQALMAGEPDALPAPAIALSNQRMMAVIERMEKRILELEHTAVPSAPLVPINLTEATAAASAAASEPVASTPAASTPIKSSPSNGHSSPTPDAPVRVTLNSDDSARVTVLLGKGKFLLSTNKAKDAVSCYDEILKLEPKNAEALVKKGSALERLKQDEAAIRCYEQAIEANRKMTLAYLSKAGICNRLGRYEEAMECYEQALEMEEAK